jgi:hypothetical protein
MRYSRACIIASLALIAGCHRGSRDEPLTYRTSPALYVHDGFEQKKLSGAWASDRFEEGAVTMENTVVRTGKQAVAVTLHSHDKFEAGRDGDLDTERDELREDTQLFARENVAYETSFSMYFPADFPIVPVRLVIAQWKQVCGSETSACSNQNPVLALRYINGELLLTQALSGTRSVIYRQKGEFRGRWLDFKFRYRFTPGADGHVAVWFGDKQVVDLHGVTADAEGPGTGYPAEGSNHFFFKMGLYRDLMPQPMTVYIDEYRKRQLTAGEF